MNLSLKVFDFNFLKIQDSTVLEIYFFTIESIDFDFFRALALKINPQFLITSERI